MDHADGGGEAEALAPVLQLPHPYCTPVLAGLHWTALPPMPRPNSSQKRSEACCGCAVVLTVIAVCVGGTHLFAAGFDAEVQLIFQIVVLAEAAVALLCLLGLMLGDPGTLRRSEARCTPIPAGPIREALLQGKPLPQSVSNHHEPERGTFCARCLLWREVRRTRSVSSSQFLMPS